MYIDIAHTAYGGNCFIWEKLLTVQTADRSNSSRAVAGKASLRHNQKPAGPIMNESSYSRLQSMQFIGYKAANKQ